jgi:two-component system chemotaxis response regulator CheB
MQKQDIVVIGSSAGGVIALKELVRSFPKDLPASVFIVQHIAHDAISYLPRILGNAGSLEALHPEDGELIRKGLIYIAPPDHHMLIEDDHILIKKGPKENRFRPAIDTMMRSAAYSYGPRVIGIVLTGYLNDGTSGLWTVKQLGGTAVVQSPEDAKYPDMPRNVMEYVDVDYNLPLSEIGSLVNTLVGQDAGSSREEDQPLRDRLKVELEVAAQKNAFSMGITDMGEKTNLTCPECGGTLVSLQEGSMLRYRCHTGHGFSAGSLFSGITESIENKLWQALRSMEEGVIFLEQSATQSEKANNEADAQDLFKKADHLRDRSKVLLDFIYKNGQIDAENL